MSHDTRQHADDFQAEHADDFQAVSVVPFQAVTESRPSPSPGRHRSDDDADDVQAVSVVPFQSVSVSPVVVRLLSVWCDDFQAVNRSDDDADDVQAVNRSDDDADDVVSRLRQRRLELDNTLVNGHNDTTRLSETAWN